MFLRAHTHGQVKEIKAQRDRTMQDTASLERHNGDSQAAGRARCRQAVAGWQTADAVRKVQSEMYVCMYVCMYVSIDRSIYLSIYHLSIYLSSIYLNLKIQMYMRQRTDVPCVKHRRGPGESGV